MNEDDQQLTIDAVEAAGYRIKDAGFDDSGNFEYVVCKKILDDGKSEWSSFSPLKNSSDALRLMAESRINVIFGSMGQFVKAFMPGRIVGVRIDYSGRGAEAALRRAIVTALARESTAGKEKLTGE